ncbi:hypothetical protein EMPS_04947 [Entomortierella parvispora]|uniref:Uncharacterized protein n=1 Tax=Entomortierella parvispora TaxID=205924 RepID=A0A9P3H9J7_9FUNG|nr:hypothetical protein EMPS_04947 [Entomortierella parvispora]
MQRQPTSFLLGHVAPVMSLDCRDWMLASGSEDKTCRIWDLRTEKVHKALTGFDSAVTTTSFTSADVHTIYVGSGRKIYTYDLRMESLLLNVDQAAKVYDGAEDEINQIDINYKASYLAACDDAGDVRVLDLKTEKWMRPLERKHQNIAMTVQFVPKKELQALTGGMDKLVVAWDFYKGRATQLIETETPQPAAVQSKQLFNPPFVHSIAAHPSGTRAAVGLGDGTVQFLHTAADPPTAPSLDSASTLSSTTPTKKNKKKAPAGSDNWVVGGRLVDAHSSPIATIGYAGFNSNWLVTSANNGTVAVWDDQAARYESSLLQQEMDHRLMLQQQLQKKKPTAQAIAAVEALGPLPVGRPVEPILEFKTTHVFERVNCIATSQSIPGGEDGHQAAGDPAKNLLFVAGTHPRTGDKKLQGRIAVYPL